MWARRRHERGQVAVYAVVLFPLLVLVMSLVYVVGNVEDLRSQIRADLDMAALTATQALDPTALATGAPPRLLPDEADQLARQYLAQNLAGLGSVLAESPSDAASAADVAVTNSGDTDPITGSVVAAPTVTIRLAAPVHISLLSVAGLPTTISLTLVGSAAART
jgi:Flp pilus assembly protein TadG